MTNDSVRAASHATHFITALTNDKARLIVNETRTTDAEIAKMVTRELIARGFIVVTRQEG